MITAALVVLWYVVVILVTMVFFQGSDKFTKNFWTKFWLGMLFATIIFMSALPFLSMIKWLFS